MIEQDALIAEIRELKRKLGIKENPMNQENYIGFVPAEKVAEWKAKYPLGIYFAANEEGHIGYFKNPTRLEVNCALSKAEAGMPLAPIEELANLTFLGGSDEILKNDTMSVGIQSAVKEKLDGARTVLVNL